MKLVLLYIFFAHTYVSFGQMDSLDLLRENIWRMDNYTHFGADSIILCPIDTEIDSAEMTPREKLRSEDFAYGKDVFYIDSSGHFQYLRNLRCAVGEDTFKVLDFKIKNGVATVKHSRIPYRMPMGKRYKDRYRIQLWTKDRIILVKINE